MEPWARAGAGEGAGAGAGMATPLPLAACGPPLPVAHAYSWADVADSCRGAAARRGKHEGVKGTAGTSQLRQRA